MGNATDKNILEKLWLVYEYGTGSSEAKIEEALNLFDANERQTTTARWIEKTKSDLDWDDNIYDLIELSLKLPKCPQKYRDDTWTPLETKMKDAHFVEFYTEYQQRLKEVKKKHNY